MSRLSSASARGMRPVDTHLHAEPTLEMPVAVAAYRSHGRVVVASFLFFIGALSLLLLVVPGTILEIDGRSMLEVTRSLVAHGDTVVRAPRYSELAGVLGVDGQYYSKYGPGQSLVAVPFYIAGQALATLVPPYYRPEIPTMAASLLPAVAIACTAALIVFFAVELGASSRVGVVLALIYLVATPAIVYATQWFSEPLTGCVTLLAVYSLVRRRDVAQVWRPFLAGIALSIAIATRLDALLFLPPLVLYLLLAGRHRFGRLLWFLLPLGLALASLGAYNAYRFGSPMETGYSQGNAYDIRDTHAYHGPGSVLEGLYGLLLSPGKGLLEYAPPTLLAPLGAVMLWARRRAETLLLIVLFLVAAVAHADILIRWVGGWSWGPRFLVPVIPYAVLLLVPLFRLKGMRGIVIRGLLVVLTCAGIVVQVPALIAHEPHTYIYSLERRSCPGANPARCTTADSERIERDYINQSALSPIVGSWSVLGDPATWTVAPSPTPRNVDQRAVTVAPHTWWRLLALQGADPVLVEQAMAVMAAVAALFLVLAAIVATSRGQDALAGVAYKGERT